MAIFFYRFGWVGGTPATYTIPLAPADFLYHGWGSPPMHYFFFQKKKVPKKNFGGQKKNRACGPKISGIQKSPKRSFFGLKNVKIFESNIHFFFVGKKNHPINETEKALFNRNSTLKKKKNRKKFQNFGNFYKASFFVCLFFLNPC